MLGTKITWAASLTGAPTLSATTGVGQVVLNWTNPGEARYPVNVYRNGVLISMTAATATSYTDTIAAGTYTYTVAYVKNGVALTLSNAVAGVSQSSGPAAPTLGTVTSNATGFLTTANWTNAGSFTTRIYSRSGSPGSYTYVLLGSAGAGATSVAVTTSSATSYTIIARHFNGTAESVDSNAVSLTTNLGAPTSLSFSSIGTTSYTVLWTNTDSTAPINVLRGGVSQGVQGANVSTFNATGLSANTQYSWSVRYEKNAVTGSSISGSQWTRPNAPTSLSVSNTTTPALSWANAHALTTYIYRNGVYIGQVGSGVTTYSDTTVEAGTLYNYTVRHFNSSSGFESSDSNQVSITTALPVPQSFSVVATSASLVQVSWVNATSSVTTFVERSTDGTNYSVANGAGTSGTTFDDTGRVEATTYWYRARHLKGGVYSAYTSAIQVTTPIGSVVQNFVWTNSDASAMSMSWTAPGSSSFFVQLYRAAGSLSVSASDTYVTEFNNATSTFTNTGLSPATTYTYGVRYRVGSAYGDFRSFTRGTRPSNLTSFTATVNSDTSIQLSITRNASEVIDIEVERSTDNVNWTALFTVNHASFAGGSSWTQANTGLTASTTYYYRARGRYTALNGLQTYSAAYTTTNATTSAPAVSLVMNELSPNFDSNFILVSWSVSNMPSGGYATVAWAYERYTWNSNLVDYNSGSTTTTSPYVLYTPMDILENPVPDGDGVIYDVWVRIYNSSNALVAQQYRQISLNTYQT